MRNGDYAAAAVSAVRNEERHRADAVRSVCGTQAVNKRKIMIQMIQRVNFILLPFHPICSPRRMARETGH